MNHELNAGIARTRLDEMISPADRHRFSNSAALGDLAAGSGTKGRLAFRRAAVAVGLSILLVLALVSTAFAVPPESGGGSSRASIVKTSHSDASVQSSGISIGSLLLVIAAGSGVATVFIGVRRRIHRA